MNFESHLNPDERILDLNVRKKEILDELHQLNNFDSEEIETQISHKENEILEVKEKIYSYTDSGPTKEGFDFDGYSKEIATLLEGLIKEKKDKIEEKRKLEDLLKQDIGSRINELLEDLHEIENQLN